MKAAEIHARWIFIPISGILLFAVLYIVAAQYYPGGSNINPTFEGFDWINNYWCDLIALKAKNGASNISRLIALPAMAILFSSLAAFWFFLPRFFHERRFNTVVIRYTGSISMFILMFISTRFHDSVISIGICLLAVPIVTTLKELYRNKLHGLYLLGCICVFLILLNIFIYWTNWWIDTLPFIQKFTLVLFLTWIISIGINCWRMDKINLTV